MGTSIQSRVESGTAHLTVLSEALDRLKQEHEELMQVLLEMEAQALELKQEEDITKAMSSLMHLKLWTAAFMEELERHSNWEEKELFPFLHDYFHKEMAPSIIPSFWMLEKDHELA